MAMKNRTRIPNPLQQGLALTKAFPDANVSVHRNRMRGTFSLQPTGLSDSYLLRIEYSLETNPKVYVVEPELRDRDGKPPPHLYRDGSLCLYLPGAKEWENTMYIVDSIVPWASEWLFHYEIWLATGEWHGGGIHPGESIKLERDRPARPQFGNDNQHERHSPKKG